MFKTIAVVGVLGAAFLTTACNGSSPTAPSLTQAKADGHVEPPGVLSTPNAGARAHVEPPGVLLRDGGNRRQDIETSVDVEAR